MNKKVILLSDLFNHGIKSFTSIGRNFDPHSHGTEITIMEKITTIKKLKKCSFICKKQKKIISYDKRENPLFESPCRKDEIGQFKTLKRGLRYLKNHKTINKGVEFTYPAAFIAG